jgi:hypothetical protein
MMAQQHSHRSGPVMAFARSAVATFRLMVAG